jgi:hypothetical protein
MRGEEHTAKLYDEQVKAGSFVDAEGKTQIAGITDSESDLSI